MLTDQEKNVFLHFLGVLNDNKIKNLANSITQGRINSKDREEAIRVLLLHGDSLFSIMSNKKVNASCLLNYLHHLQAPSSGNATKETLLQQVYSIWKLPYPIIQQNNSTGMSINNNNLSSPQTSTFASINNQNCTPVGISTPMNTFAQAATNVPNQPFGYTSQNQNTFNQSYSQMQTAPMIGNNFNQFSSQNVQPSPAIPNNFNQFNSAAMQPSIPNNFNQFNSQMLPHNNPEQAALQYPGQSMMNQQYPGQSMMNQQYPAQPSSSLQLYNNTPKNTTSPFTQAIASYQLLSKVNSLAFDDFMVSFAKMFYELLNNAAGEFLHGLNRSHFFEECKMMILIKGQEEDIEQNGESVVDVLNLLSDLKREHQLTFNPNLTPEGVRGKTDSHGLIYAVASGTLHHGRCQLVGVFEQSFILRKDPFEQNSCKIADTTLILRSSNSVNSFSQLLLPASKKNEQKLALEGAPHQQNQLQITNFSS